MERPGGPTPPATASATVVSRVADNTDLGELYDAADGALRRSQVPSAARKAAISPSLVTSWLFNVTREVSPPSVGPGPVACAYGAGVGVTPSSLPRALSGVGGPVVLFPLVQRAQTEAQLCSVLRLIGVAVRGGGAASTAYMQNGGGHLILAFLLRSRRSLLGPAVARECFAMAVDCIAVEGAGDGALGSPEKSGGRSHGRTGGPTTPPGQGKPASGDKTKEALSQKTGGETRAAAWSWERDLSFLPSHDLDGLLHTTSAAIDAATTGRKSCAASGRAGGQGGASDFSPFVLLTDPYALKHLLMNHQARSVH